jgi:RNA polymerase sigma factor (sigma-70 family)
MQDLSVNALEADLEFFKAKEGDKRAIRAVIERWTPLIHKMVNKYGFLAPSHQRDDLVQMGRIAVVEAIDTYTGDRNTKPATWIWYKVRGKIQGYGNKQNRHPKYNVELDDADRKGNLEDQNTFELREDYPRDLIKKVLESGCRDGMSSRRAQIVCSRFGLFGEEALAQGDVAKKFGISKQAVNGHLNGFYKKVQKAMPGLRNYL